MSGLGEGIDKAGRGARKIDCKRPKDATICGVRMHSDADEQPPDLDSDHDTRSDVLQFAATSERVVDEHMFRVDERGRRVAFRLQVFTADGVRPVAVATQNWRPDHNEGMSLPNASETFASVVWRQYFPDDAEPPIWIERMLSDNDPPLDEYTTTVTYTVTGQ